MKHLKIYAFAFLILFNSCQKNTQKKEKESDVFQPVLMAILVKNLSNSINWYKEKLNFEIEKVTKEYPDYNLKIAFLKLGDFHLELIENGKAVSTTELSLNPNSSINGFLKIGLMVDDINLLYNHLKKFENVDFITQVGDLPTSEIDLKWPKKFLLIRDPDGNMIQFFSHSEKTGGINLKPWLIGITVKDIEAEKKWFIENLGFKYHISVGKKGNIRSILERNNFVLELFEPSDVIIYDQQDDKKEYHGIKKLSIGLKSFINTFEKLKKNKNNFVIEPKEVQDFNWAKQFMIIKDPEGNWLQFYEMSN